MTISALTATFATQLAPNLKRRGFSKTGPTWHRKFGDAIHVVNLQKSQWGDQFYVNIGIYLMALGKELKPTEYRCHVRCHLENLLPRGSHIRLSELLDFDRRIFANQRFAELRDNVGCAVDWLNAQCTVEVLARYLKTNGVAGFFITAGAWHHLGLSGEHRIYRGKRTFNNRMERTRDG